MKMKKKIYIVPCAELIRCRYESPLAKLSNYKVKDQDNNIIGGGPIVSDEEDDDEVWGAW